MAGFRLEPWLLARSAEVDALLAQRIPALPRAQDPGRLVEAVRYTLLASGKRLRPMFAVAAAEAVGTEIDEPILTAAASVELVHCYSLIHDDLPAMDDDDFRRGKPASHKAFGEATAILAGDALLTLAFEWLAEAGAAVAAARPGRGDALAAVLALARGAGISGMVRGQARDLGEPAPASLNEVELLHGEKTAALFRAAAEVGGAMGGASPEQMTALGRCAFCYGVAFQHADDLADREHAAFADRVGPRIGALVSDALAALGGFGQEAEPLRALVGTLGSGAAREPG